VFSIDDVNRQAQVTMQANAGTGTDTGPLV